MRPRFYTAQALILILVGFAVVIPSTLPAGAKDKVINFADNDKAMNAAIASARKTLPAFWRRLAKPAPTDRGFSIKVRIADGEHAEHFWTRDVERKGDVIHARIDNDPNTVTTVRLGQRIKVDPNAITDWLHWRGAKMQGAYTLRVMLPRMPAKQADKFRAILAPLP